MHYPDPTIYAIPFFLITLVLEPYFLRRRAEAGARIVGFERRDTLASLGMGVGSLIFVSLINLAIFHSATWLAQWRLFSLGEGVLGWTAAMVGWDFAYYWNHRIEHENRLMWACHVNHHSSQHYNLSTALRQPWTPVWGLLFFPPLALLGVEPWMIMAAGGFNLIYQYWVHTEAIDRLPAWFEAVFNTPSQHRVHHGSNPGYLDCNYAGILIIWDRIFGSFVPETEPVRYGLTKNIDSFNLLWIAVHEYVAIARDIAATPRWSDRLAVLLRGPGWRPPQRDSSV